MGGSPAQGGATGGVASAPFFQRIRLEGAPKLDVLFMIDNSRRMRVKQALLAEAIPAFLERLSPLRDIHLGVITSSLGDMGSAEVCPPRSVPLDDRGELVPSIRDSVASWNDQGFLAWDPDQAADPPGTAELDELAAAVRDHVDAVGETGCGYEASLEAWYRFLIDPEPPESVSRGFDMLTEAGPPNETLLAQREAFLRPDSVVAIVMLTDENDCSVIDYGQGWIIGLQAGGTFYMPRATAACTTEPNSPCCFNCSIPSSAVPAGCTAPASDVECQKGQYRMAEDHPNLRCYQQKRRFGLDLLQPTARYVEALTRPLIFASRNPDLTRDGIVDDRDRVQNPLYRAGLSPTGRDPSMVFLAGIVGVPWQDLSDEADWDSESSLRFLTHDELVEHGRWEWILGSSPADSLMFETDLDRSTLAGIAQEHPAGFGPLAPSNATDPQANPINGHESNIQDGSDLQAACVFPLAEPFDCSIEQICDCKVDDAQYNRAVCQGTLQTHALAYPSVRPLEVLKGFGDITGNAVVTSICPKVNEPSTADRDSGYIPALDALASRMQRALAGACLTQALPTSDSGQTSCAVLEVSPQMRGECPPCNTVAGRKEPEFDVSKLAPFLHPNVCYCELAQFTGDELVACRSELETPSEPGFCYVDDEADPGEAPDSEELARRRELVAGCSPDARRILRFGPEPEWAYAPHVYLACDPL